MVIIISNGQEYSDRRTLFVTVDNSVMAGVLAAFARLEREVAAVPAGHRRIGYPSIIATAESLEWRQPHAIEPFAKVLEEGDPYAGDFPHVYPCPIEDDDWAADCTCWYGDLYKAVNGGVQQQP